MGSIFFLFKNSEGIKLVAEKAKKTMKIMSILAECSCIYSKILKEIYIAFKMRVKKL